MTDTPVDSPPSLLWLKGDEVVLLPDGSLKREAELFDSTTASRPGHIRQAIAMWPSGTTPTPEDLAVFGSDTFNTRMAQHLRDRGEKNAQYYRTLEKAGYIWETPLSASREDEAARAFAKDAETAAQATLRTISNSPEQWLSDAEVHHAFTEMPLRRGKPLSDYCINDVRFKNAQRIFTGQPVFTSEFAELFAYDNIPITVAPRDFFARPNTDFLLSAANGLALFSNKLIRATSQSEYEINNLVSQAVVMMAGISLGVTNRMLNIPNQQAMESIRKEFNQHRDLVMNRTQQAGDDTSPMPYPAMLIISQLHFALNSGLYNPLTIRHEMPQSVALYERFMDIVREHVNELKSSPAHNPLRYQEGIELSKPATDAVQPPAPPILADFGTHPFSENPLETSLIESTRPIMAEALSRTPPCTQFRCRLVLDDNNTRHNYPINLTFRNDRGDTAEYTVFTGTGDLDEAIALKKMLQSHILNHENMTALYMNVGGSPSQRTTATDAFIPDDLPTTSEIIKSGRRYEARLVFTEGTDQEREFILPLGLLDQPRDQSVQIEAERRFSRIEEYLLEANEAGFRISLGDIIRDLKRDAAQRAELAWHTADRQKLDHYDEGAHTLPFASGSGQNVILTSSTLYLEEGARYPNPTWRLRYTLKITGLGADGDETQECEFRQNLHTSDELTAQARGSEAIEFLSNELRRLGQSHPGLRFEFQDRAPEPEEDRTDSPHGQGFIASRLALRLPDGSQLPDPEPHNLLHITQDMPNPKTNFRVGYTQYTKGEDTFLTLNVERGTEAEGDIIRFKGPSGKELSRTFKVSGTVDDAAIEALMQQLNGTFGSYIKDAYGNRTADGMRKPRQAFQPKTIENLFDRTVEHHILTSTTKPEWLGNEVERPPEKDSGKAVAQR
ncbi:MAG TPA: hypothetical protein VFT64_02650 [Rickettsiales bacterium]|nr:hypothetical protein [Rickettsiales bacterium]